jgi:hypothetical protein
MPPVTGIPDPNRVRARFEALGKALYRRLRPALMVCIGATVGVSVIWAFGIAPLLATTFGDDNPLLALVLTVVGLAAAVLLIPSGLQLLVLSKSDREMIEGYNAFAMLDQSHLIDRPRFLRWSQRNPEASLAWMASHRFYPPHLALSLLWAGRVDDARAVIAGFPSEYAHQRFQKEVLTALVAFLCEEPSDLQAARAELELIPEGPERDYARALMAVESARRELDRGGDWPALLIDLRRSLQPLPPGASIADQFRMGVPIVLAVIGIGSLVGLIIGLGAGFFLA